MVLEFSSKTMTEFYSLLEGSENLIQPIMRNVSNITIEDHVRGDVIYFAHPEEMLTPWKINSYFPFIITTYIITFIIGVTGNIIVIAVMACDSTSRNVTSIFLVSLAVADLLLLVVYVPLDVAHYFVVQWDKDGTICRTAAYAEMVSAFASVLNLVAVTLERFVVIVFPIKSRSLCTMGNCKQLMVVVWIFSLLLSLPVIASKSTEKTTMTNYEITVILFSCKEQKDWRGSAVAIYRLVALFGLPLVLMIICYAWVIIELWISTKTMDELTNRRNDQKLRRMELHVSINQETRSPYRQPHRMILRSHTTSDSRNVKRARQQFYQVIKMLILVVFLFLVCWGPRLVLEIYISHGVQHFNHWIYTARIVFFLLPVVHSCLNPIVYCFMSSNIRRCLFRSLEHSCRGRCLYSCLLRKRSQRHQMAMKSSVSRNGTIRTGSTYTFTSFATSMVCSPSGEIVQPRNVNVSSITL
ncbi:allatostatin-A receptor-like [Tachypleus tridentatus]|uniref:allatostatin-A receptor-like n=1 Tax=Tachypleus tridentatus TaxID=6853 RepID=UPI003FD4161E